MKNHNLYFMITVLFLFIATIGFGGCGGETTGLPSNRYCVCLDPGHPSENNDGAEVVNGLKEVEVNWDVALLLKKLLDAHGVQVVMTKVTLEQYVINKKRAIIANQNNAHLFLRLHCDSGGGHGITFYYPNQQGTIDGKTGPSEEIIGKSQVASDIIHSKTVAKLEGELNDRGIKGESETFIGSRQGALTASIYSEVPVVTVEMVFLDDVSDDLSDVQFIKDEEGKQKMAEALKEGIMAYLSQL